MKIVTDKLNTRGLCEIYAQTKKERKLLLKLHSGIMDSSITFTKRNKIKSLIIFRTD